MMLRSRNANVQHNAVAPAGAGKAQHEGPIKRNAKTQPVGEPQAKRVVLNEISNGISNFLIDSSKKSDTTKPLKRGGRRSLEKNVVVDGSNDVLDVEVQVIEVKKAAVDPCPEFDFDAQCADQHDDYSVPTFAFDIFRYYRTREKQFAVHDYMHQHPKLSKDVRAVLVDWMVEVQESFELNHETLYLAVKLLDLYLSRKKNLEKDDLQLISSACVFVAAKFDERSPPLIDDFMYLCEDNFIREEFIRKEMDVLNTVGFDLGSPLSYRYLRRLARVTSTEMPTLTLSRFILEQSLCYYEFVGVRDSLIASAAFFLALKMKNRNAKWTPILHKYSGYTLPEIESVMHELNHMLHQRKANVGPKISTVVSKYSHFVFHSVAKIALVPSRFDLADHSIMEGLPFSMQE